MKKKVLVFGTFDIFHEGHKNFLLQARKHGDLLRVVVARDVTVVAIKGFPPQNNEQTRLETLAKSGLVDEAVLGSLVDRYEVIREYEPDIICLGYDQKADMEKLKKVLQDLGLVKVEIKRLNAYHPEKFKSSKLRTA
jgi:cytidyltransferase-like protein